VPSTAIISRGHLLAEEKIASHCPQDTRRP
jgi:hypothetical protein